MSEKFKQKYNDPKLKFFYKLLPEAKNFFKNVLGYLEKSLKEENKNSWFTGVMAIQSVAKDMCFDGFKDLKMNEPNEKDFKEIERIIEEILLLEIPSRKRWSCF